MKNSKTKVKTFSHILILLLCVVMAVVATFSWYIRSTETVNQEAGELNYTQTGNISGNGCTVNTYAGSKIDGEIVYSDQPVSADSLTSAPNSVTYFKTVLKDESTDTNAKTVLSLYLENFKYSQIMNNSIHIGLVKPEKTYISYTPNLDSGFYKVDKLCIENNVVIDSSNIVTVKDETFRQLEIEWFLEVDSNYTSEDGQIGLGTLHIVYN